MNTINQFFASIYRWMALGVLFSALCSYVTISSGFLQTLFANPVYLYGLIGIHVVLYLVIQFIQHKLSTTSAFVLFFIYSAMTGVLLSGLLGFYLATDPGLLVSIFVATVAMFAGLALLGYRTSYDMSGWGTFLSASTFGIIILVLINVIFVQSSIFDVVISGIVLVVFAGLTVFDAQYYKRLFPMIETDEDKKKHSVIGALHMYVNFIAMFQSLLRIVGFFNNN